MARPKRNEPEIEAVRQELPILPPDDVIETVKGRMKKRTLVYRVSFIKEPLTGERIRTCKATCSACGQTFHLDYKSMTPRGASQPRVGFMDPESGKDVFSGSECNCPECGEKVTARHVTNLGKDYVEDRCFFVVASKIRGHLALLGWILFRHVDKQGAVSYVIRRHEGIVTIGGRPVRYTGFINNMFYAVHWEAGWNARAVWKDGTDEWDAEEIFGLGDAVTGSDADHCALEKYVRDEPKNVRLAAYIQLWLKYPHLENLVRSGFSGFIHSLINELTEYAGYYYSSSRVFYIGRVPDYLDLKKTKPHEIFGLEKEELQLVKKLKPDELMIYRKALSKKGVKLDRQQLRKIKDMGIDPFFKLFGPETRGGFDPPLVRTLNYIDKHRSYPGYLADLWDMAIKIYGRIPEELTFPKDLTGAHDRLAKELREKADRELDRRIAERAAAMASLCFEDERLGLMIRPCAGHAELIKEGEKLSHCVAMYANKIAEGRTSIMFIRRLNAPERPFFTLEWQNGRVIQNRGKNNRDRTPEVEQFEAEWLQFIKGGKKTHGKQPANETAERAGA